MVDEATAADDWFERENDPSGLWWRGYGRHGIQKVSELKAQRPDGSVVATEHRNAQNRLPSLLTAVRKQTRRRGTELNRVDADADCDRARILNSRLLYYGAHLRYHYPSAQ